MALSRSRHSLPSRDPHRQPLDPPGRHCRGWTSPRTRLYV